MIYKYISLFILFTITVNGQLNDKITDQVKQDNQNCIQIKKEELQSNKNKRKIKLLLGVLDNNINSESITTVADCLQKCEQFDVDIKEISPIKTIKDLTDLYNSGYILAVFISGSLNDKKHIEWRLYDLLEKKMAVGKKTPLKGACPKWHGYTLADSLLPYLIGQNGPFCSQIAYVKKQNNINKKPSNIVCSCNIDGSSEKILIKNPGIYVGTYWHPDNKEPRLFCSEFTKSNVRVISTDFNNNKQIAINMPGTCVGVSLSKNNDAVYCRSGAIWHYRYNKETKTGTHTQIIKNDGKNIYPTLLESEDIIFCSDSRTLSKNNSRTPQVYKYLKSTNTIEKITDSGYCLCPAYNSVNGKIAYSKRLNKILQLFVFDSTTSKEIQLTYNAGNKIDPSWSPCGNYLVYCHQYNRGSRIAIINAKTYNSFFITNEKSYCSSPSWSPIFTDLEAFSPQ